MTGSPWEMEKCKRFGRPQRVPHHWPRAVGDDGNSAPFCEWAWNTNSRKAKRQTCGPLKEA